MSALRHRALCSSSAESLPGMPRSAFICSEPRDECRRGVASDMPPAPAHSGHARELGHLRGRRRQVEAHHVVDHDAVGESVVEIGDRGQRMRARMHGAQVFLEGDRAHHRAHQHVASRLQVAAVAIGDGQRPRGDADAFERDAVAQRVVLGRQIRLDVVRERVHAGRRGDRRRQVERELRIGEHASGEQPRREDDLLDVRLVVRHHRRAAHLRSRAGGRRQRDEIGQRRGRSAGLPDGPRRIRGCRRDGSPSARWLSPRRAPRRRPSRSRRRRRGPCTRPRPRRTWLRTGLPQIPEKIADVEAG